MLRESERVYSLIINDIEKCFKWIDLSEVKEDSIAKGLSTVIMDDYISDQVIEKLSKHKETDGELTSYFLYVERIMNSDDSSMIECFRTTLLEKIAAEEKVKLEKVLPYCGEKTAKSILLSLRNYYGNSNRADLLEKARLWNPVIR